MRAARYTNVTNAVREVLRRDLSRAVNARDAAVEEKERGVSASARLRIAWMDAKAAAEEELLDQSRDALAIRSLLVELTKQMVRSPVIALNG